jgi:hypothetical protein
MPRHGKIVLVAWLALSAGCSSKTALWFSTCTSCDNKVAAVVAEPVFDPDLHVQQQMPLVLAEPGAISEEDLLDVDIRLLRPVRPAALEFLAPYEVRLGSLRQAESYYLSMVLANKLQRSGNWGRVRLNSYGLSSADLEVRGWIEQSDGQILRIRIEARDSSGTYWLAKRYVQALPPLEPRSGLEEVSFPFNNILNAIANDLARKRAADFSSADIAALRSSSLLKFATELAPAVYAPYRQGNAVVRLPAEDDPVFLGVQEMRMSNESFLDAMQAGQELYARQVAEAYLRFLDRSRQATQMVNDYYVKAMGGPGQNENRNPYSNGTSNMNIGRYKPAYTELLAEVNQPIEEAVTPVTFEFNGRTEELTGTIEEQFQQWKEILLDMYEAETGVAPE